ncbi:hypothetical protein OGAPHI_000513 [Ogataea philodendri]|uniref:UDENN domain-containing protein n=1 Tax=Ogataea philodendri TaxID=1378263 RepID=A0A9P8PGT7_9ASCO|nr:uncharacterized protein OGAPHI_000513 [Ogataea philodendri]KAH3671290.1 hypothetical protein OGAPHI_000513 [Ogataea philodendri]
MVPTLDCIFVSEFDKSKGLEIRNQVPQEPAIDELDNVVDLLMPLNLHKYLNTNHYTWVPLFIDVSTGKLHWDSSDPNSQRVYLYTLSYFQKDDTYRNGTAMALSILTRLPIFDVFKPLMTYLLHNLLTGANNASILKQVYKELNKLKFAELLEAYHTGSHARFLFSRFEEFNVPLPKSLDQFSKSGHLVKTHIELGKTKFPIQIPAYSLVSSEFAMYGIDLKREQLLRQFLIKTGDLKLADHHLSSLVPYHNVRPLHVLLNAVILKKKIILYSYDSCYNELVDILHALLLIVDGKYPCYPLLDLSTIDLVYTLPHYIVGTSNLLFKEKLSWDLFLDIDSNQLYCNDEIIPLEKKNSKRSSSDSKIKQLFRRSSSQQSSTPKLPIEKLNLDDSWNPAFPKVDPEKSAEFFAPPTETNYFSLGFNFTPSVPPSSEIPRFHAVFNNSVDNLISEHHGDLTIYQTLTRYVYELENVVFQAFRLHLHSAQLKSYRQFAILKLDETEFEDYTLEPELLLFIRDNHIVLPLAVDYPYKPDFAPPAKVPLFEHYEAIVKGNSNLFPTYQKFTPTLPPTYYWLNGCCFELDLRALAETVSSLIERGTDSGLAKRKVYQLFRTINQFLKSRGPECFERLLTALYIQADGPKSFEKLLIIASIYYKETDARSDEVIIEFKRFLSLVLNNKMFNIYLLPHLNDFIKLSVNDFIDYHMN